MTLLAHQLAQIITENVSIRADRLQVYLDIGAALGFNPKLVKWFGSVYCYAIVLLGMEMKDG